MSLLTTKRCPRCGLTKEKDEFYTIKTGKQAGQATCRCKKCQAEYVTHWSHVNGKARPLREAKDSSSYLGVYVAERVLSNIFENMQRMPTNNPGFDFYCGRGFKIDVKSSCLMNVSGRKSGYWVFVISKNQTADYFLCIAFDDRKSLTPLHVWLVPGRRVRDQNTLKISDSDNILSKWAQYEKPLDRVMACCNSLRTVSLASEGCI